MNSLLSTQTAYMKKYFFSLFFCLPLLNLNAQQGIQTPWVINDNFTDNSYQWLIDSTDTYETVIRENHYDLWNKSKTGATMITRGFTISEKNNYKIEADIQHSTGANNRGNGLVIASSVSGRNYYRFLISNDGEFRIDKVIDTTVTVISDWKFSDALTTGSNNLSLINLNNHWYFNINNTQVYDCDANHFFGTRMGFFISVESAIYCTSFKIYDWTIAQNINASKEPIYKNIFHDDFKTNKNEWETLNDNETISTVNNGYQVQNKTEGSYIPSHEITVFDFFNYKVETAVRHTAGANDYGYGMCIGKKDVRNTYVFMISADGSFQVGEYIDGE